MEDKTFELLTKMYDEINKRFDAMNGEFNKRFDAMNGEFNKRLDDMNGEIIKVGNRLNKLEIILENEIKPDIKASLEGYKQLAEGQNEIKDQLIGLNAKVENQDVQITVLKSRKKSVR